MNNVIIVNSVSHLVKYLTYAASVEYLKIVLVFQSPSVVAEGIQFQ